MSLDNDLKVKLYTNLVRAHEYDQTMSGRMVAGKLIGFYHPGDGGIAPGVAAGTITDPNDVFHPHHRAHFLPGLVARGADVKTFLAEHTGKEGGCCGGRSSFHAHYPENNMFLGSGFIGYQFAPAVGWGWAAKNNKQGQVVVVSAGDGSFGQGRAHESMLIASNWKLPIVYWCENNSMAIHTPMKDAHPTQDISSLAKGYDMPAIIVDGMDVFACAEAAQKALEHVRSGKGPIFVECKTMRFREHDMGTQNLEGYTPISDERVAEMRKHDPLELATKRVLADDLLTQEQVDQIKADAKAEVEEKWAWADAQKIAAPTEEELLASVFAE